MPRAWWAAIALAIGWARIGTAACPLTRAIAAGDTLPALARTYLGDRQDWPAILLATNSRTSEGFVPISDLYDLRGIHKVCIPRQSEARRDRLLYEKYLRAVRIASVPERAAVVSKLVEFPPDHELEVATWIPGAHLAAYRNPAGEWLARAPEEIWVTAGPHLREFCSAYAAAHGRNPEALTLRLEQRLGLPPGSGNDTFLEIRLMHPDPSVIFRPCLHAETNTTNCPIGPPGSDIPEAHRNWIYRQYYSSYGVSLLQSFPWTALGYTFDWSSGSHGAGTFQRVGESEFVIRRGAPIEILRAVSTAEYCISR